MEKLIRYTEDYPFNKAFYQGVVRSVFNKAEVKRVQVLTGGNVNKNFVISLTNPETQVHLRVYVGKDAEDRANKERIIYDLLAKQTNIPIPTVYVSDSSRSVASEVFALHSLLPGVNLKMICDELPQDERKDIASQIGGSLAKLHTIYFKMFGDGVSEDTIGDKPSWKEFFLEFTSKNISCCEEQGIINSHLADSLREHIARWQWLLSIEQPPVLVHRDFHLGNVKVQKDQSGNWRISGIFDFEHAIAGHNEFDFTKPYWAIFEPYPDMREPMLSSYSQAKQLSPFFDLRMNRLYRLAEIIDFLVFGTKMGLKHEIDQNIGKMITLMRDAN